MKILLVEDEYILRLTLIEAFETGGHEARAAANGHDGLQLFEEFAPDVVVTDLAMPGMSGVDMIRLLRVISPEVAIVVLTAAVGAAPKAEAEEAGASLFLTKPVSAGNLIEVLEAMHRRNSSATDGLSGTG